MAASDVFCADLRLLLVGKTGVGKSSTGNTILGVKKFNTGFFSKSVTKEAQSERAIVQETRVEITDSPGLFDTEKSESDICFEVVRSLICTYPGPHAVLYVMTINGRYTDEELNTYKRLKTYFGEQVTHQMIIILTFGDLMEGEEETMDDFYQEATMGLKQVLEECGKRYLLFNNKAKGQRREELVNELFDMIGTFGGSIYDQSPYSAMTKQQTETEIEKRLAKVRQQEVKNNQYVKELNKSTEDAKKAQTKAEEDAKVQEDGKRRAEEEKEKAEKERDEIRWQLVQRAANTSVSGDEDDGTWRFIAGLVGCAASVVVLPFLPEVGLPLGYASTKLCFEGASKMASQE